MNGFVMVKIYKFLCGNESLNVFALKQHSSGRCIINSSFSYVNKRKPKCNVNSKIYQSFGFTQDKIHQICQIHQICSIDSSPKPP